jgi:hypothetical protein
MPPLKRKELKSSKIPTMACSILLSMATALAPLQNINKKYHEIKERQSVRKLLF